MNRISKRTLLAIIILCALLPSIVIPVFAETCTVDGCELTYSSSTSKSSLITTGVYDHDSTTGYTASATWIAANNHFELKAGNSTYFQTGGLFNKHNYYAQNYAITLTVTNNTSNALRIEYTVSGTVDSHAVGAYTTTLLPEKSLQFVLSSKTTEAEKSTDTSTVYTGYVKIDSVLALVSVDVSFASSSRGDYTYQISGAEEVSVSKDAEASETQSLTYGTQVTLTKGTVDDGYAFYGWMASGKLLGTADGTYAIEDDAVIYPVFLEDDVLSGAARYKVGNNTYWLWGPAFADAKSSGNTVIINESHALPTTLEDAGLNSACTSSDYVSISNGNATYTVPYGCKLLLPYDSGDTGSFTSEPTAYISEADSCTMYDNGGMAGRNFVYRFLSIPASVKIDCYGQINVNGQRQNDGQPYSGVTLGGYGKIELNGAANEEQLVINSGATLYCYGYITGTGMVNIASGGTIHELMQVCDWPGGTNASNWNNAATANASLFALSQYYVQNVESDLKFNSGASAYIEAVLTATGSSQTISAAYVGTNSGLFLLQDGYVIRLYDESSDRMTYCLYGTLDIGYLEIKKTFLGQEIINLNSSNYVLPLGNNMTIQIESGSTLNMSKQIALVPGSEIIVANGASMNLSGQIYIVDVKDWSRTYFYNRASMTDPSGDTSITVTANTSADFAPVPYVATLNAISPRTTELVRGCTVDKDDGSITQRYYMKAVNCSASGKLVVNGTLYVTGAICTTNANNSANKVVTGIGMIDYDAAPNAGTLKGGYSSTIRDIATTYGLANIAGVGTLQPLASGIYYGQSNGYWYNWKVTGDADVFTVTAGQTNNQTDALGLVSYYWDGSAAQQSAFAFNVADATACPTVSGTAALTYTLDADALAVDYGLSGVGSDVALNVTIPGDPLTTIQTVASNADHAPISSKVVYFPEQLDISALWGDQECDTPATSDNIGGTVYTATEAVAAIAKEIRPEDGDPYKDGDYVQAFMTVQAAVEAATGENTYVTVLQTRTLTTAIVIGEDQNITLDLGGYTLTGKVATVFASATGQKLLTNNGTLRLINGTITFNGTSTSGVTFDTDPDENKMAATVYNLGTIDYIEEVTLTESSGSLYTAAILNGAGKTIKEIRSGTIQGTSQSGGTGIINFGTINTIGTSERTVTITGRRGIEMLLGSKIDLLGGDYSTVTINGGQRGINIVKNTTVTTIGGIGSTVNFNTGEFTQHKSCIFVAGNVTTIGGEGSTLNLNLMPESDICMCNYGINISSGANIGTIGAAGSVITITGASAQTEKNSDYRNDMYGIIISGGTIQKIGSVATDKYSASKLYINVSHSGKYGNVAGIYASGGTVVNLGADGAVIFVNSMYTGTDNKGYGIYNNGTITNFGVTGSDIEVICNQYGIYNSKTISAMDGVTVISTDETGSYYGLYNSGTISTISDGYFYHGSGARDKAVRNPDSQNYITGYTLSTDTFPVPASDGTVYNCYYLSPENAAVTTWAANVVLGNNLDMMFGFKCETSVDGYYVKAVRTYSNGAEAETTRFEFDVEGAWKTVTINGENYYVVTYGGFAAKEMCDTISLMVCDSNGNCISTICTDSIQAYALRMLEKATDESSPNENLQTVIVDMLNYGAACQTHFGYNTANLANAELSDEQKSFTDPEVTKSTPEGDTWNSSNLITDSNIEFALALNGISAEGYVTYSFTGHKGNEERHTVYYKNMGGTDPNTPYILIPQLVVADARCTIEVTVCKDGTTTETWYESIEAYVARKATSGDVYYAFMKFADSAKAYLESK